MGKTTKEIILLQKSPNATTGRCSKTCIDKTMLNMISSVAFTYMQLCCIQWTLMSLKKFNIHGYSLTGNYDKKKLLQISVI